MRILMAALVLFAGCATPVYKIPVDTRCQKQESLTLTEDEAKATPRSVLDKLNASNCALWLSCPEYYEVPAACSKSP